MTVFSHHTIDTAPEASRGLMQASVDKFGFLPNIIAVMAESPAMIEAYITIMGVVGKTGLNPVEQQVVLMTINSYHECNYCMAAHSMASKGIGMDDSVLEALRDGTVLPDARLQALSSFTQDVLANRGYVSDARIEELLSAGYEKSIVMDVIVCVAGKTLSNYVNHVGGTLLDDAFAPMAWTKDAANLESV